MVIDMWFFERLEITNVLIIFVLLYRLDFQPELAWIKLASGVRSLSGRRTARREGPSQPS